MFVTRFKLSVSQMADTGVPLMAQLKFKIALLISVFFFSSHGVAENVSRNANGFELSKIAKNSVFERMGLKEGDIVKKINGESLTDANQAISLLNSLDSKKPIKLEIERAGKAKTIQLKEIP